MSHLEHKPRRVARRAVAAGLVAAPLLTCGAFLCAEPASDFLPQITIV